MNDFRKYATGHLGMNGMVLDDVMRAQAQYLNPYILEERQLNVTQMDVFSRLMMERIIFLGTQVDDYSANTIQAQLLYLDSVDPGKDISIYDLAYLIKSVVGYEGQIAFDTSKPDGTMKKLTDPSKLNNLGWHHTVELEEGIKRIYDWYTLS